MIRGTAAYRERIALPPNAVFEATLEDVSKADVLAEVLGRARVEPAGQVPIRFEIPYDPSRIQERNSYSVRGRITVDGQLWFTTDRVHPVLTRGHSTGVELQLRRASVSPAAGAAGGGLPVTGAHGLRLPATFRGDLPCADCEAIRHHLDLWPDQAYHLRREWVGRGLRRDEVGRWRVDPARNALLLDAGGEMPLQFEIKGPDRLRLLDREGKPIPSKLPYLLTGDGTLAPTELSLTLAGEVRYMADAARFTECLTGRGYPVAMEADFVKMERACREAGGEPGAPVYVTFEGSIVQRPKMEGPGLEPAVVVGRFIDARPGEKCGRAIANASLANTYWRIVRLGEASVSPAMGRREPHLLLGAEGERKRFSATVGCNQLAGGYSADGEAIRFTQAASTLMACPPPLDMLERKLPETLDKTRRWRIKANTLEFLDDAGVPVALFEAVYF